MNLLLNLHANHFLSTSSSTKKQIKVRRKAAKSCSLLKFLPMSAPSRCHQPSAPFPAPSALIGGKNWRKCATRLKKDRKYGEGRGKERLEMVKSWLGGRTWDRGAVVLTSVIFFQIARSREDIVQGSTLTPIAKEACGLWRCLILWYDRLCMWHQGRLRRAFIKEIYGECCRWDDARTLACSADHQQDKDKDNDGDTKWDNVWLKQSQRKRHHRQGGSVLHIITKTKTQTK